MTLDDLARLGRELMRRGWTRKASIVRDHWRAVRKGKKPDLEYSIRLAGALGLGPKKLEHACRCTKCKMVGGGRTVLMLEDRAVFKCWDCGTEWISMLTQRRRGSRPMLHRVTT